MTSLAHVKFYITQDHACSYLPEQRAKTLFADPYIAFDGKMYTELSQIGFRRSGNYLYKPYCDHCKACIPIRIPVKQFKMNRRQKHVWFKNQDLMVIEEKPHFNSEFYTLYKNYIAARHSEGDMYPATEAQYQSFLLNDWSNSIFFSLYKGNSVIAVTVVDKLINALSAVYTFFDPEQAKRSLGSFAILYQIEKAKALNLPFVYLGYWIKNCHKMNYKSEYRPLEMLINQQWVLLK